MVIPPEIEILGNSNVIADNDITPSTTDDTDFGSTTVGSTVIHTFTVNNTGEGVLNISKLKMPKGFVLVEGLSSQIAAHGSDTFQVRLDTAKAGVKAGQITFTTNDPDEGAFNFSLLGNVTAPSAPARQTDAFGSLANSLASLSTDAFAFEDATGQTIQDFEDHGAKHAQLQHFDLV